ncbi:MAG TPA: hypothetical protein VE441_10135 [Mycobacterium sp.]|nr:hypothetical protein [Mycobacterium sp.]
MNVAASNVAYSPRAGRLGRAPAAAVCSARPLLINTATGVPFPAHI